VERLMAWLLGTATRDDLDSTSASVRVTLSEALPQAKGTAPRMFRRLLMNVRSVCLVLVLCAPLLAQSDCEAPNVQLLRYEEDYGYLSNARCRSDLMDSIKYLSIGRDEHLYLSIGGEIRERFEYVNNPVWGLGPHDYDGYSLQRYMLHADFHLSDSFRFFIQLKSGLEYGRAGGPRPPDRDTLDVNQAFADVTLRTSTRGKLILRVGRQEMMYGSSRLVSVREGPNVHQTFDGARLSWLRRDWQIDAFATKPVQTNTGIFDDSPDPSRWFWGVYAVRPFRILPKGRIDLYYLGIDNKRVTFEKGIGREQRHSVGTRLWGSGGTWDYNYEGVLQWGRFGKGEIRAWTISSDNGYRIESLTFRPRLGLKADIISGDRDPSSRTLGTFNALYPKGAYFSDADLIGPYNLIDIHPSIQLELASNLSLTPDADFFWRQSIHDGIYGVAGGLLIPGRSNTDRYIGAHTGLQMEWRVNRSLTLTGSYVHFFDGEFLKRATPGRQINFTAVYVAYKF